MPYKYGHEDLDLFVESQTDRVPNDGAYYIVHKGMVGERFPSAKKALSRLNQMRFMSGIPGGASSEQSIMQRALSTEIATRHAAEFSPVKADRLRKGGKGR